ncbi:MAG: glycosyltransferase [Gammaproteobacteria bacterium]|nr:glycosyltransferase [Gammaproteobacteria bacterium]
MKVLHISNAHEGGGAENVFAHSVAALSAASPQDRHLTACCLPDAESDFQPDLILESWQGKKSIAKQTKQLYNHENFRRLVDFLSRENPDLIHLHEIYGQLSPSVLHALEKARVKMNFKIVQTIHTFFVSCANFAAYDYRSGRICTDCAGDKYKLRIFYRNCDRRGWVHSWAKGFRYILSANLLGHLRLVDHFICPSNLVADLVIREGIDKEKVSVIYNPVLMDADCPVNQKHNEVVYFGRFSPEKNIPLLIAAMEKLFDEGGIPDLKLTLIGEGEERERICQLIKESHYANKINLLHFQSQERLIETMRQAKVSVLPSFLYESFGLTIPESVLMNILPVVTGHGGMKEVIDWLGCGYKFLNGDVVSLAATIGQALKDYDQSSALLSEARGRIDRQLRSEPYAKHLNQCYCSLLN